MDITEGSLSYKIGLDYSEVLKGARQVLAALGDVDAAMGAFGNIDDWSDITKESLKTQKEYIKQLEAEYERLGKAIEELPDGDRKSSALSQYKAIGEEIEGERKSLLDMEDAMKANELATARLQVQYRSVIAEMQRLRGLGMDTSEEYAALADKAKELKDAMEGVTNELKPQNTTLSTMASGITTVTGAMSAAMGVVSLFGDKSERLNEIMMKMQSLMAITVGLQQVSTNLSRQSTLMLGIEAVQRSAAAKAAMMQAKGTAAATIAQKAFNVVAKANPYVLLATALVTVVGALAAFSKGSKEAKKQEEELQKKAQEAAESQQRFNDAVASSTSSMIAAYQRLRAEWKKLVTEQEKRKWIIDNKNAFAQLGLSINNVDEAEKALIKNTKAVIESFTLRSKSLAYQKSAVDAYEKLIQRELELDKERKKEGDANYNSSHSALTGDEYLDRNGVWRYTAQGAEKYNEKLKKENDRQWKELNDSANKYITKQVELEQQASEIISNLGLSIVKTTQDTNDKRLESQERYLSELKKAQEKAEDLEIANMGNTIESRERKIRTDYGRQIAEAEAKALSASTPELEQAYRKQAEELKKSMESAIKDVYKGEADKQKESLNEMLDYYTEYTYSKKKIDEQYQKDLNIATLSFFLATTDKERKIYSSLIHDIGMDRAKQTLDLSLSRIDATAYENVEDKMAAINEAYDEYIAKIKEAGASSAEENAALVEKVEATGRLAVLNEKIAKKEGEKLIALENGDIETVKKINAELDRLRKLLAQYQKDSEQRGSWDEFWTKLTDEEKAQKACGYLNEIGDAIIRIGEAAGSSGIKDAGEAISGIANAAQGVVQGFAQGGIIGAAVSLAATIGNEIIDFIATEQKMQRAIEQAGFDKFVNEQEKMLDNKTTIFGSDSLSNVNDFMQVITNTTEKLKDLERQYIEFDEKRRNDKIVANFAEQMAMLNAYSDAVDKGVSGLESMSVRTKDRNGFANWLGLTDEFKSMGDAAKELGYDLYDEAGKLNKEALQAILKTYNDLGEEERQWIENAIKDLELYEDAVAQVTEYLTSMFGDMADTIADQLIDSFMEGGEAAMDFGEVVSDVTRKMAKDFIKSMLMEEVFEQYEAQFKKIMLSNGMSAEEKQKAFLALFASINDDLQEALPGIQAYLESFNDVFGGGAFDQSTAGNLLQSASQDSIDLVNGQMNAIRMNQMRIADSVDSIILQLGHIHNDMNNGFDRSVDMLTQINMNMRSSDRSPLNGFGLIN